MIVNRKQRREQEQFLTMLNNFLIQQYKTILEIINNEEKDNELKIDEIKYLCNKQLIEIDKNYKKQMND